MRGNTLLLAGLLLAMLVGFGFGATLDNDIVPPGFDKVGYLETNAHDEVAAIDPAMLYVDCAANGTCSTAAARTVRRRSVERVAYVAAVAAPAGRARNVAVAAGGRVAQAGGRLLKVVTAPIRAVRGRAGRRSC
jgi:hypothetical protein